VPITLAPMTASEPATNEAGLFVLLLVVLLILIATWIRVR
jgi:hypothetical protein